MNPSTQFKKATPLFVVSFVFACFALSPVAQATPDPGSVGGVLNTADGFSAMPLMSAGTGNSAFGAFALFSAESGNGNTAVGVGALINNTTSQGVSGDGNTAVGAVALFNNTIAPGNTAVGAGALLQYSGLTGGNTAVGAQALQENTGGAGNTAVGVFALHSITGDALSASKNTAVGQGAMENATTGLSNTAVGAGALDKTTGDFNIAVGNDAGKNLTTGDNNIDIGNEGVADEANTIRIGADQTATFIAGISGQNAIGGDAVFVTSTGKLGTVTAVSSARFKDDIKPMEKASEVILALKPVTFRYKKELDSNGIRQFGLVAEQVEKIAPDLVKRDREGNLQTVRYEAVNAMLLNEFLKEHRKVERLEKQVKALSAGLQKVSAQLEMNKPAPRTVLNNQ